MLLKIAWRNIWRSRSRSLVVMGSIVVGIWALIFAVGFMNGFMVSYMADIINHDVSNVQIHHPEFKADNDIRYSIPDGYQKARELSGWEGVKAVSTRVLVNGMIASPQKAAGVQVRGVVPGREAEVTRLDSLIAEGAYFAGVKRNPVVIGNKLAEELGVHVKSKVVLTFNDRSGHITSAAFRVAGIVKSASLNISQRYAFVIQEDLSRLLGLDHEVHEIAVLTDPHFEEQLVVSKYDAAHEEDLAETWREIAPELALMQEMYGSMLYVLTVIIMLALVFGIVNTMLMAVLERIRELGMLMAVGMTRLRVFLMVMLETICLGVVGAPVGLLVGWATIYYFTWQGVDLSNYSEGLEAWGYSSILYPYIENSSYLSIAVSVVITAFVAAIYPAWKAIRLNPVEALHTV